jgi:hypothetical protein
MISIGRPLPVATIIVAHQIDSCGIPRECLYHLLREPFCSRIHHRTRGRHAWSRVRVGANAPGVEHRSKSRRVRALAGPNKTQRPPFDLKQGRMLQHRTRDLIEVARTRGMPLRCGFKNYVYEFESSQPSQVTAEIKTPPGQSSSDSVRTAVGALSAGRTSTATTTVQ